MTESSKTGHERPEHAIEFTTRVGFHECDPLGVAWHGRYFEWMEEARTELFKSRDLDVPVIAGLGHRMFVVETKCRFMIPLRYGDEVLVRAWFVAVEPLIRVGYDFYNAQDGRWSARAVTQLATTDVHGELLPTTPDALLERLPRR